MYKKYLKAVPLGRLKSVKTILCIWATWIIPSIGPCKVSKQINTIVNSSKNLITKRKVTKNQKENKEMFIH